MDNNSIKLEFTELTSNDMMVHERLYISILLCNKNEIPDSCVSVHYDYATAELQKANDLFQKTFK